MTTSPGRRSIPVVTGVVALLAVCGALLGAAWARVAPPIHTFVGLTRSGERVDGFLGKESDNLFVAGAMLIGLLAALAIVSAVSLWQWRTRRGPGLLTALWIGQIAAGVTAAGVGTAVAHWRYGAPDKQGAALSPENRVAYFTEAPPVFLSHGPLQIAVTLLLPAALSAVVYALLAMATPRDDLGAGPSATAHRVTVDGAEPVHRA